jgi:hypothetical protein
MAKNVIQDMVKVKTVRNEIIEQRARPRVELEPEFKEMQNDNNGNRYGLWLVALISVVFLLFALSFLFSGARITASPKTQNLDLDENFTAVKDSDDTDNLSFDLVAISGGEIKTVQGGEAKEVDEKAQGNVVLFNAFSSSPQMLSINTRLEGSNGKIYETEKEVIVPGMANDGTPGSIEVGVYGREAGTEYNSVPIDFKIFGFRGTPKYSKFYGRSEGAITGGLKGKFSQISDVEKTTTINDLRNLLQADLLKKVTNQIPNGYVLFNNAVFLEDDGGSTGTPSTSGLVPVDLNGTLYGFIFNEEQLANKIIQENIEGYNESEVYIPDIQDLTFSIANSGDNVSFESITNITFNLSGSVNVIWKVDSAKLVSDLLGKRKKDFNQILSGYPNIASADLVLKPFWNMYFPSKSEDIKVIVNYPK